MKKVVLIRSNPVNPDPPVEKMANTLILNGYQVTILGWDRESDYKEKHNIIKLSAGEAEIIHFGISAPYGSGIKNIINIIKFQSRIKKWLKKHKKEYDIIHSFDLDTGMVSNLCAKKYKKKFIYHILDEYAESHVSHECIMSKVLKKIEKFVIEHADATIICTEKREKQIEYSKPKKLVVIHNSPEQIENMEEVSKSDERTKLVFVGTLNKGRFIEELIEIVKEEKDLELHLGGYGFMETEVQKVIAECDRIYYYGKLTYPQTLKLEAECDIMTAIYSPEIPNHKYSAPNKIYEAMMLGKPVIVTKGIGWDDVFEKQNIGELAEFSKEGVKTAIYNLKAKRSEWEKMACESKDLYKKCYSWDIMAERVKNLYESI